MINQLSTKVILSILFIVNIQSGYSQNCFNSDFESGDVSGYDTFIGTITNAGNIILNTETLDPERHKLVSILDGYDEIAMEHCDINKYLPVVPPSGGVYAMRLGNSNNGSEAERISLRFTVTDENSFFLLRYAVLLNDPSHEDHQQPRFKLSIKDQNGEEYPCGKYEVIAAPNIENFENCNDDWKVRPWTNIGIELKSYLGEEIVIDMMTVDCALGAHAGYAYLDATCRPLDIELFNNCTDTSTAIMRVTSGFDAYEWSTGDLTSEITIPNPVIGDIYYVTVTSATGCQLELSDTIPSYEIASPPSFGPPLVIPFCKDTTFWFSPPGTNLQQLYSINQQSFVDSILVNTAFSSEYTFVALSDAGCAFDTVSHYFGGTPGVLSEIQQPCNGSANGFISLLPLGANNDFEYEWSNGMTGSSLEGLQEGTFIVTITDPAGCALIEEYTVDPSQAFSTSIDIYQNLCSNDNGSASVSIQGGTPPYEYSFDQGASFQGNNYYDQFVEGQNVVLFQDANACHDSIYILFDGSSTPIIDSIALSIDSCGNDESSIIIHNVINGTPPFLYAFDNMELGESNEFDNIPRGLYKLEVQDAYGCTASTTVIIPLIEPVRIKDIVITQPTCDMANGSLAILTNATPDIQYAIDAGPYQDSNYFENMIADNYLVKIKYGANCLDSMPYNLEGSPSPTISPIDISYEPCTNGENSFLINIEDGLAPFNYQLDDGITQSTNAFVNVSPGNHTIQITDSDNCVETQIFEVVPFDSLTYQVRNVNNPDCGVPNGDIELSYTGGKGDITIEYASEYYQEYSYFDGLADGLHSFILSDEAGCTYTIDQVLLADCQIYIPNIFSPNNDGVNDNFTVNIANNATAIVKRINIYDRWGEPVYSISDYFISGATPLSWNGKFKGKLCPSGVYTYELELELYNREVLRQQGSVTLFY